MKVWIFVERGNFRTSPHISVYGFTIIGAFSSLEKAEKEKKRFSSKQQEDIEILELKIQ